MQYVIDNNTIAILTTVNSLAARYRIMPYEFVAVAGSDPEGTTVLRFEAPPDETAANGRFEQMLASLGLHDKTELSGSDEHVLRTLQEALERAPRTRSGR